ncbi:MAG: HNH endonuclease [Methylobacter sp.]|nr:MAG: HNH endonuclease [Methylobacter sp.]
MIKLQAIAKPNELTDDVFADLTTEYKNTDNSVWKKGYITKALLTMSFGKCCFCETKIDEESKYMEVEHFHPKSLYPDEVVLWINLLPICKRCNGKKSDHDTKLEPIIHPVRDDPKEHLKLKNYRFCKLTELGESTISAVDLNDRQRLVNKRYEIGNKLIEELESLIQSTKDYITQPLTRRRNKITGTLKNLMLEGCKESAYSATAATVILEDDNFQEIKRLFIMHDLWTEFIELEEQVSFCAFLTL